MKKNNQSKFYGLSCLIHNNHSEIKKINLLDLDKNDSKLEVRFMDFDGNISEIFPDNFKDIKIDSTVISSTNPKNISCKLQVEDGRYIIPETDEDKLSNRLSIRYSYVIDVFKLEIQPTSSMIIQLHNLPHMPEIFDY